MEGGRDGGREGGREGRREGGRDGGRERRREGGREGGRGERWKTYTRKIYSFTIIISLNNFHLYRYLFIDFKILQLQQKFLSKGKKKVIIAKKQ